MIKKIISPLFIFSLFLIASFLIKRYKLDLVQEFIDDHLNIKHGRSISQQFSPTHNNLSIVKILEANNPIIDSKPANTAPFTFKIIDQNSQNIVRSVGFSGANVGVLEKLQFKFEPIVNSKGKDYLFVLESNSSPSAAVPEIALGFTRKEKLQNNFSMTSQAEPWIKGNLAFRMYYKNRMANLFADSMSDFLYRVSQDKIFLTFYISLLVSISLGLFFTKK